MIHFHKIAIISLLCQFLSLWSRNSFGRYIKEGSFWFSFWHFCQYVWHTIYANWASLISIVFSSIGLECFFSHLTVCTSNSGHETSLIIFLIRACILRCHYSVRAVQSPDLCNLDSKYHLHSSGGMVSSSQCVFTWTNAHMHTHIQAPHRCHLKSSLYDGWFCNVFRTK